MDPAESSYEDVTGSAGRSTDTQRGQPVSRRTFLWNSGIIAGGVVVGSAVGLPSAPAAAAPHQGTQTPGSGTRTGHYLVENDFISLGGDDGGFDSLRVDPHGGRQYALSTITSLTVGTPLPNLNTSVSWEARGPELLLGDVLVATGTSEIVQSAYDSAPVPSSTGSLGQSFTVSAPYFTSVSGFFATYNTTDSGMTLRLRAGGPGGDVVATETFTNMPNDAWVPLKFPPLPGGIYYLEMLDPVVTPAWWTDTATVYNGGSAFVDGKEVAGSRTLLVNEIADVAKVSWLVRLRGRRLESTVTPEGKVTIPPLQIVTPWQYAGYDVAYDDGVLFSRFMSDTGQYLPVEEFKRRVSGVPALAVDEWAYFTGTGPYDLRFLTPATTYSWAMASDAMTITPASTLTAPPGAPGLLEIEVLPHSNFIPPCVPVMEIADSFDAQRINSLYYHFALDFGIGVQATWFAWESLILSWTNTQLRTGLKTLMETYPISEDGYVWSWVTQPYWPLDNPTKYNTRHYDNNARYILGAISYFCWTNDSSFLNRMLPKLRNAMNYQLNELNGSTGILLLDIPWHRGKPSDYASNYWDDLPFGYKDAYDTIYFYASLAAMSEIEELVGNHARAQELLELRSKVLTTFNDTFWSDEAGRYIGTIDVDGNPWDFGFTYVNLEAMAYGLASKEQAARIYHWMEAEPTASGQPDTYSAFEFAPRVNTSNDEEWWYLGGHGVIPPQPFGTHIENGGADFYTSGFDLMARARLMGADNALERLSAILDRFWLPDRLAGGAPLFRGENPGWQVGTELPFPESGLVGAGILYAFLGLDPRPYGLEIAPNLPSSWPYMRVQNISFHGRTLQITATHDTIEVMDDHGRHYKAPYGLGDVLILRPGEGLSPATSGR